MSDGLDLSRSRVLLVDDDKSSLDNLVAALQGHYLLSLAIDGESALASIAQRHPDLVVLDLLLPRIDGYEVCRRLRAEPATRDLPIIFLSALGDAASKARGFEAGGTDYVTKPFEAVEVRARVRSLLEARMYQDAVREGLTNELRWRAAIIDSSPDAIISTDVSGSITSWNPGAEQVYGFSAAEALGKHISLIAAEELETESSELIAKVKRGETVQDFETRRQRKDDRALEVSLTLALIRNADGSVRGISGVTRDISERRAAAEALRKTEEQLRQAQKMEALGRLTGGIAHDFNNLLSVILSYAQLLLETLQPGDPMREDLLEISLAGNRAANLTRQLLTFSQQQIYEPRLLDLNETIAGINKMLVRIVGEDIQLITIAPDAVGRLSAAPGSIEQVVMNLVINARDALPAGGKITMETADVVLDEKFASTHLGVVPGPYVMLAVGDNGAGMDPATQARIFEPFFTTKPSGKGTGLGLATVFGIVKQSGAAIFVESELGRGSTFRIYFPRVEGSLEAVFEKPLPATLRGTETVLLVEDEVQVRGAARSILRRNGYRVLDANGPGEALLVCEKHPGAIDLLLTDVVMPQLNGLELAQRLSAARPDMKVLCMSGYTDRGILRRGVHDAGIAYLQKPITPETLARKVREVLGTRGMTT